MSVHVSKREKYDLDFLVQFKDMGTELAIFISRRAREDDYHNTDKNSNKKKKSLPLRNVAAEKTIEAIYDFIFNVEAANCIYISETFTAEDLASRRKYWQEAMSNATALTISFEMFLNVVCALKEEKVNSSLNILNRVASTCKYCVRSIIKIIKKDAEKAAAIEKRKTEKYIDSYFRHLPEEDMLLLFESLATENGEELVPLETVITKTANRIKRVYYDRQQQKNEELRLKNRKDPRIISWKENHYGENRIVKKAIVPMTEEEKKVFSTIMPAKIEASNKSIAEYIANGCRDEEQIKADLARKQKKHNRNRCYKENKARRKQHNNSSSDKIKNNIIEDHSSIIPSFSNSNNSEINATTTTSVNDYLNQPITGGLFNNINAEAQALENAMNNTQHIPTTTSWGYPLDPNKPLPKQGLIFDPSLISDKYK